MDDDAGNFNLSGWKHRFCKELDPKPNWSVCWQLNTELTGEIESLTKSRPYIEKISEAQDITEEQLLNYVPKYNANSEPGCMVSN